MVLTWIKISLSFEKFEQLGKLVKEEMQGLFPENMLLTSPSF